MSSERNAGQTLQAGQYLMFTLGRETFGCRIACIREIIECPPMTAIPLTPAFLRGVINLRGAVVPVIDLSVRFERGATRLAERTCIVIVEVAGAEGAQLLGVIVDGVTEVLEVDTADLETRPSLGAGIRADFVAGMIRQGDQFVLALDMDRVLSGEELERLVDIQQQARAELAAGVGG
ncbi:MAG TPA: chemotaxis protein CheW [Pseudomonas sp.]|jgi:purine-binding chemotaxis protein CheW|nr:chemotaxis protein CheW [Pseudomonas sp.]